MSPHHISRRRTLAAAALAAVSAVVLTACGGGSAASGSGSDASDIDAALKAGGTLTYWTWTGQGPQQVAAFEKAYPQVKVKLVNAGTGNDEYTKLSNAVKAGSGAPDVAQIEYAALPQFALQGALLDLTPYGLGSLKSKYAAGTWSSVNLDGKLYGLPQDSGPMALFYNKAVFDKHNIAVPTTWDQYVAAAEKLHAEDPKAYITTDSGDPNFATSMIWEAGGRPFKVDGTHITINLQDAGTKKWTSTWNPLVERGLLSPTQPWTQDWYKQLGNGQIATLIAGSWMRGVLEGSAKQAAGDWRVAATPTYGASGVNSAQGGSAQSVVKQSKNPALAAAFLRWLNSSDASVGMFEKLGGFPSTTAQLNSQEFLDAAAPYFGGQKVNQVFSRGSAAVTSGFQFLPYQVYANSTFADTVGQSYQKKTDLDSGLKAWQDALVKYGNNQGFSVTAG